MGAFHRLDDLPLQRVWDAVTARVVHGEQLSFGVVELEPGSVVPEHSHENEQFGLLLQGALRFRVGDETSELGPGATWSIPANVPHAVEAGSDGAVVVDVFSPPRHDWKALERVNDRSPRWPPRREQRSKDAA